MRPWLRVPGALFGAISVALFSGCALFPAPFPPTVGVHHDRANAGALRVGAAAVDITPGEPVWLGGYAFWRRSQGVHDSIYARALVIERGDFRLALVALDVVGVQSGDLEQLRERLPETDPHRLIISSTHNHSGPDTLGLWGLPPVYSGQSASYMEQLEAGVVEALARARAGLRPAEIAAGSVTLDPQGILKNLRQPGLVDRELVVLHAREAGGGPGIATLVELGCHPEVLTSDNRLITADFPGWTVARLEQELGGVGIYVSGALGGLVTPDIDESADGWSEAQRVGSRVGKRAVDAVLGLRGYTATPELALWHGPLYVRNDNPRYDLVRMTGVLNRQFVAGGYFRTEVNVWQIGSLRLATIPGEITPDLGLRIREVVRGRPTMLVGLANDELGYLIPEAEFDLPLYDYERTVSPGRDAGDRILRRFEDLMLYRENRAPEDASASDR